MSAFHCRVFDTNISRSTSSFASRKIGRCSSTSLDPIEATADVVVTRIPPRVNLTPRRQAPLRFRQGVPCVQKSDSVALPYLG